MEEDLMLVIDEFLKESGFDVETLTLKQKKLILKKILFNNDINRDLEEIKYTQSPSEENKGTYIDKIQYLEMERIKILGHIYSISMIEKESRKLKRKETVQKVMTMFKKYN